VLVTGHSDNQPIRTARFPSNWHLSEERARTVSELLASQGVAAKRLRAEGRADAEPVAPNDSPASRALNRRVEITLFVDRPAELGGGAAAPNAPATSATAGSRP
jgi:type VI secretion system protein ImpK